MRLIDADALLDYIDVGHYRNPSELCFSENDIASIISRQEEVDAVPVVRCINCKNARLDKFACLHCLMYCRPVEDDFYCADYERMDGGKNA